MSGSWSNQDGTGASGEAGQALTPVAGSPVSPFFATADERTGADAPTRGLMSRLLDYSAHIAIVVGLAGFAWTVGAHMIDRSKAKPELAAAPVADAAKPDELAELRLSNQKMREEIKSLKASVDTLRTAVRRDTTPEQVRMLSASLDSIKGSLKETSQSMTQLNTKVDKLQVTERAALDPTATATIPKASPAAKTAAPSDKAASDAKAVPAPPTKPVALTTAESGPAKSDASAKDGAKTVLTGWVVRDVYQGVALIKGKHGTMEVVPGTVIPGAGTVKTIERHGNGWTVTTTKGQMVSAATPAVRDYRRSFYQDPYAGPYAVYRDDF